MGAHITTPATQARTSVGRREIEMPMWAHVFFGMILYQVFGSIIDYEITKKLEKKEEKKNEIW